MKFKDISVALVNVINEEKKYPMNKDLNGGIGTYDYISNSWSSRIIQFSRSKINNLPVVSFSHLQAIFLDGGVANIQFFEGNLPKKQNQRFNMILIFGSIVDFRNENKVCLDLKKEFPDAKIGFFGNFPTRRPEIFKSGDFVIAGEAEAFFMEEFSSLKNMAGIIRVTNELNINKRPTPSLDNFPLQKYSYSPGLNIKPFFTLQGSMGCPYSCGYYCTYGAFQGKLIRQRTAKKIVDDIITIKQKYGIKSIQFRDPVFGLKKGFIDEFCDEMKKRKVKIKWGMETRPDLINEENLSKMFDVGLRLVNIGIETIESEIAKQNKRKLVNEDYQEAVINYCYKKGIKVSAFFILGLENDTEHTIKKTIDYAINLNIFLARFSISTPYPGTQFFDHLNQADRLLTQDFEEYTQFNLVYDHPNLKADRINYLLELAYRSYYFRTKFFLNMLKWKIRDYWL